ncbi:MAG: DUF4179 domain-containing protein [Lachnospiraceae bacterium]|nr:DUF4179 domain-containing protein [Lachnospiraceae bacterium]
MDRKNTIEKIISQDLVVPEIVSKKEEEAFEQILKESKTFENIESLKRCDGDRGINKVGLFKKFTSVAACIAIIAFAGVTGYAAIHHVWNEGMKGAIWTTDEQQQQLTNQGMAKVFGEQENYKDLAVTDKGVTVCPETVVADDHYIYLSFSISGFQLPDMSEPGFDSIDCYLKSKKDKNAINLYGASFYSGIIENKDGVRIYDDGSKIQYGTNGGMIGRYVNRKGQLEYNIFATVDDDSQNLLGEKLCVDIEGLGTVSHAVCNKIVDGNWNFEIPLPEISCAKTISIEKKIPKTVFSIYEMTLSPISMEINYTVNGDVKISEDENDVPEICGVVLSDGTKLSNLSRGNATGYFNSSLSNAYARTAFRQAINVEDVRAILVQRSPGETPIEISIP